MSGVIKIQDHMNSNIVTNLTCYSMDN
jgi:hypothetical protein